MVLKSFLTALFFCLTSQIFALGRHFVYLSDISPNTLQHIRYASYDNFIGEPLHGYHRAVCILTRKAAEQLLQAEMLAEKKGYYLMVYDCYRPQQAVNQMVRWVKNKENTQKEKYYPNENKSDLIKKNYIASYSSHTRGSTVDITLVNIKTMHPINMGTLHDFFDPTSFTHADNISAHAKRNRNTLAQIMTSAGFSGIASEWWHFTLDQEPYPHQYFNFAVQ